MFRAVDLPAGVSGKLYLHSMPGRYESFDATLAEMQMHGISQVVCLVPLEEIEAKSPAYAQALRSGAQRWQQVMFPIVDFGVPNDRDAFLAMVQDIAGSLRRDANLLVHCGAGVGRTGTVAASVLVVLGVAPGEAQKRVEAAGSFAERPEQVALIDWVARQVGRG